MKIQEYGEYNKDKVILVHGFQSPVCSKGVYINKLKDDYRVVVPIMPGHDINNKDEFHSFSESREEFLEYYIKKIW